MATSLGEVIIDFLAEADALDALLRGLGDARWLAATPAQGWDIRDSVTHLAVSNELALDCVVKGKSDVIDQVLASGSVEQYEREHLERGRNSVPGEVARWWRATNVALADALAVAEPQTRIPWGPTAMSAASFVTARLMETWAHGLDCFAGVGVTPRDTVRLRHIAHLGLRTLGYAFAVRGLAAPGSVRLELAAPDGATWRFGPDDAATWIAGSAGDWCRVVTHRDRAGERERLTGGGPDFAAVVANAQAYLAV